MTRESREQQRARHPAARPARVKADNVYRSTLPQIVTHFWVIILKCDIQNLRQFLTARVQCRWGRLLGNPRSHHHRLTPPVQTSVWNLTGNHAPQSFQ